MRLTNKNTHSVNDFANNLLAMIYEQNKDPQMTEFLTVGGIQLGTPKVKQQWVDDFLASRPQNTSMNTLRYYQGCLYPAIEIELTPKGINSWLTSLDCGNAKLSYYRAMKAFCNWLHKSKKMVQEYKSLSIHDNKFILWTSYSLSVKLLSSWKEDC